MSTSPLSEAPDNMNYSRDKNKCQALGCDKQAKLKFLISAGKFGGLWFLVCKDCIEHFKESVEDVKPL